MATPVMKQEWRVFARHLAMGATQADAYRAAYGRDKGVNDNSTKVSACKLARRPEIQARVAELLKESKVTDLDSVGEAWSDLRNLYKTTVDKEQFTAASSLMRQRLQGLGALKDNLTIQTDNVSDDYIIDRLSQGDPDKAAMLKAIVGQDSFDDPQ